MLIISNSAHFKARYEGSRRKVIAERAGDGRNFGGLRGGSNLAILSEDVLADKIA